MHQSITKPRSSRVCLLLLGSSLVVSVLSNGNSFPCHEAIRITSVPVKPAPRSHLVEIKDMQFQPATVNAPVGDTIVWLNRDLVAHNVTEVSKTWASPLLGSGKSWKMAVRKSADYFCTIHSMMKGKIVAE